MCNCIGGKICLRCQEKERKLLEQQLEKEFMDKLNELFNATQHVVIQEFTDNVVSLDEYRKRKQMKGKLA